MGGKEIAGFEDVFEVDAKCPRIEVEIYEEATEMTREEAVKFAEHAVNITGIYQRSKSFTGWPLRPHPCPRRSRWRRCGGGVGRNDR